MSHPCLRLPVPITSALLLIKKRLLSRNTLVVFWAKVAAVGEARSDDILAVFYRLEPQDLPMDWLEDMRERAGKGDPKVLV